MTNLFFPQLSSGALVQYPVQRVKRVRTIKNLLADGTTIMLPDPGGSVLEWTLSYGNLSEGDVGLLQSHFTACAGPLRPFTFIDPTDNMIAASSVLTNSNWLPSSGLNISGGVPDPQGGVGAFTLTNTTQVAATLLQTVATPIAYQYCLSVYVASATGSTIGLVRNGTTTSQLVQVPVGSVWSRVASQGRLPDTGVGLTVGLSLLPGQSVTVFGIQLEAQIEPSNYRATANSGGVYSAAHWSASDLIVTAEGVNQFSTTFLIETPVWG